MRGGGFEPLEGTEGLIFHGLEKYGSSDERGQTEIRSAVHLHTQSRGVRRRTSRSDLVDRVKRVRVQMEVRGSRDNFGPSVCQSRAYATGSLARLVIYGDIYGVL